jgi:hypothetical protein
VVEVVAMHSLTATTAASQPTCLKMCVPFRSTTISLRRRFTLRSQLLP